MVTLDEKVIKVLVKTEFQMHAQKTQGKPTNLSMSTSLNHIFIHKHAEIRVSVKSCFCGHDRQKKNKSLL